MLITEDRVCCLLLLVGYFAGFVVLSPHVYNILTPFAQSSLLEPPFVLNIFSFSKFTVWILHNCLHTQQREQNLLWGSELSPCLSYSGSASFRLSCLLLERSVCIQLAARH